MRRLISVTLVYLLLEFSYTVCLEAGREDDRCDAMIKKIDLVDKATLTDNTPSRLHATWVSQECEVRAGPKYVIRKYSFFKNDTFLLLQYHYAEESCSIATYTVVARGFIQISSPSTAIPGAVEADVQLDSVHLVPLNRQVAKKIERRMNASCGGIEAKWRPYAAQLIYERSIIDSSSNTDLLVHNLNSNSLQSRLLPPRKRHTFNCLESFDIEFTELRVLRVEIKRFNLDRNSSGRVAVNLDQARERIELLLGGLVRNVRSQKPNEKPNRLQSTSLVRVDTAADCPSCGSINRATEYSPPLFHQAPSLPAVIGGLWLSAKCESVEGGLWLKRFFRIYSDDSRWFARWTYYADSTCSNPLYTTNTAGTYVQRAVRQARDAEEYSTIKISNEDVRSSKFQGTLKLDVYRHVLQDSEKSIMLRVYRSRKMKTTQQGFVDPTIPSSIQKDTILPSGTTELELRVLKSLFIPVSKIMSSSCKTTTKARTRDIRRVRRNEANLEMKTCPPRTIDSRAILRFKAKIGLDWKGDYTLLLASWKDDLWEAPLRRCSETTSQNYFRESWKRYLSLSRKHNRYYRFNRRRRHWFLPFSFATCFSTSSTLVQSTTLFFLYWLHFVC